jgi:hypothetical protein
VFDRRPGWFQVALTRADWEQDTKVWIQDATVWRFHPVTVATERERLAREVWGREHDDVRVKAVREVDGALWLDVELMSHSTCGSRFDEPIVKARGWIPAHAPSGEPTVWYSARGC